MCNGQDLLTANIQASTGKTDIQLKVLQVVLQLANALAVDPTSIEFLTTSVIGTMLSVSLQLCDSSRYHSSVVSSAFATVRQLMAIIMDDASENLLPQQQGQRAAAVQSPGQSPAKSMAPVPNTNELPKCAELFIKDLSNFAKGLPGEWLNGKILDMPWRWHLTHPFHRRRCGGPQHGHGPHI